MPHLPKDKVMINGFIRNRINCTEYKGIENRGKGNVMRKVKLFTWAALAGILGSGMVLSGCGASGKGQ